MNYSEELGRRGLFELTFAFPHGGYHRLGRFAYARMFPVQNYFSSSAWTTVEPTRVVVEIAVHFSTYKKIDSFPDEILKCFPVEIFCPKSPNIAFFCVILRRKSRIMSTKPVLWRAFGYFRLFLVIFAEKETSNAMLCV